MAQLNPCLVHLVRSIMYSTRSLFGIILPLLVAAAVNAQPLRPELEARLQRSIDSIRAERGLPGVSASVLLHGQGVWRGCAGISHAGTPLRAEMVFGIGSNSKLFTAAAVLHAAEAGLLDVEDTVGAWLPAHANIAAGITLRQLLNHQSGLADVNAIPGYQDSMLLNPGRIFTREEALAWVGPPHFAPGTSWEYSNTNYLLAGMIVERATGRGLAALLREEILAPLGLDSTTLPPDEEVVGVVAHPWAQGGDIFAVSRNALHSAAWCAGAMFSSSGDMARWYDALFAGRVLGAESMREMTTFVGSGEYGFGISRRIENGRTLWVHGGSIRGYSSFMLHDSAQALTICVLVNATQVPAQAIALRLLEVLSATPTGITRVDSAPPTPRLYPNPASTVLHVRDAHGLLRVYDVRGALRWEGSIDGGASIPVAHWPRGMYVLRSAHASFTFMKL